MSDITCPNCDHTYFIRHTVEATWDVVSISTGGDITFWKNNSVHTVESPVYTCRACGTFINPPEDHAP